MNTKNTHNNGFTLIELLFSIALIGFMLTIMLTTFIGVFRFYNWSKTTRNTQVAARSLLDTISKDVRSGKIVSPSGTFICINRTDGFSVSDIQVKSEQISVVSNKFQIQYYSGINCSAPTLLTPTNIISPSNMTISNSSFSVVNGPNVSSVKNPPNSVVVTFTVVNGTPAADGKCTPGDNFCDLATFTTAVMER